MWVIAGVLLGLVVLTSLIGFHAGPHAHFAAGGLGLAAAVTLVILVVGQGATALLWVLLVGDLSLSVGLGFLASRGLKSRRRVPADHRALVGTGAVGIALGGLDPEGIVRVHGEDWSAVAINSPVQSGGAVRVVRREGLRLEVWGDELLTALGGLDALSREEGG